MGINITEIGQKVLDNNTNAANVFRKMYDLHYNPNPLDVPFEYIDENGNKVTTTIKNVAGFRKRVWDDVGGALGQFNRIFYVDVNGDDNNTGSSDSPFKTIKKAINSVPVGGYGKILLKNNQEHIIADGDNYEDIVIQNRNIIIAPSETVTDDNPNPIIKFDAYLHPDCPDNTSILKRLEIGYRTFFTMTHIDLKYPDPIDDDHPFSDWLFQSQPILFNGGIGFSYGNGNCSIANADKLSLVFISRYHFNPSISIYGSNMDLNSNSFVINNRSNSPFTFFGGAYTATENGGDDNLYLTKTIKNIVKDADSGNPINVISNINFSD